MGNQALLVFVYQLDSPWEGAEFRHIWRFRGTDYEIFAVELDDYLLYSRLRSASWQARNVPKEVFRYIGREMEELLP